MATEWNGKRVILWPDGEHAMQHTSFTWKCVVVSEDNVSEWVYNPGPTQFFRVLTFRNGRLEHIELLGCGY